MNDRVLQFLALAKHLSLTEKERRSTRAVLLQHMALHHASQAIRLTAAEKQEGRAELLSFLRAHPVQAQRLPLHWFQVLGSFLQLHIPAMALAALLIFIGGGAAYAVEYSLPGDILYPMKVRVIEPLRERLLWSPTARAVWTLRRVERRLEEVDELALSGRLTEEQREKVERRIAEHVTRFEGESAEDPDEARKGNLHEALALTLATHAQNLPARGALETKEEVQHIVRFLREERRRVWKHGRKMRQRSSEEMPSGGAESVSEASTALAPVSTSSLAPPPTNLPKDDVLELRLFPSSSPSSMLPLEAIPSLSGQATNDAKPGKEGEEDTDKLPHPDVPHDSKRYGPPGTLPTTTFSKDKDKKEEASGHLDLKVKREQ